MFYVHIYLQLELISDFYTNQFLGLITHVYVCEIYV